MADGSKKRRQWDTGSVYQRSSDGRWLATIDHGYTPSGGRRRITVSAKSRPQVLAKLKTKQRELAEGKDTQGRTTVKKWSEDWLQQRAHRDRPKTHTTDKGAMRYVVATIGHKQLSQLTPGDVRALHQAVMGAGRSSTTARRYHGTLMRMLKAASAEGHNVAARVLAVEPPDEAISDRQAIPLDQSLALLSVAAEVPHGSRWAAALLQGVRQGEALGLTWDQVDLDAGTLTISWQLQPLPYRESRNRSSGFLVPDRFEARQLEGRLHLVRPKSRKGWRVQPLVPWMTDALRQWKTAGPESPHGLVWPALDGSPAAVDDDRDEWAVMQETVGVQHPGARPYHVHEARHATAMLLLALEVPESVRIAIMGHSSIASTRAYEHDDITLARRALERLAERLQLS